MTRTLWLAFVALMLAGSHTTDACPGSRHNVVRPSDGTVWDLRLLVEVVF